MDTAGGDYKTREKKMNHRGTETQRREEKRRERKGKKKKCAGGAKESAPSISPYPLLSLYLCFFMSLW
jgi:hypothetical protein